MIESIKQIIANFPLNFVQAILSNLLLIVLAYLLVWKLFKNRLAARRIQAQQIVNAQQIKRELKNAFFTLGVGVLFSSIVLVLNSQGYSKIYTDVTAHNTFWSVGGFFILLLIDDTWFYWCHRLLHHPKLFRHVHLEHHKSIDVNPFTSLSFHFLEPFLLSFWIFPVAFLIPVYAPVLLLIQLWGLLDNIKSHLGYELYPAGFNNSPLRFFTSSTYHNMHHRKFKGNYGVHFRFWDKLLGTEFKEYEAEYDKVQQRKKAASVSGTSHLSA